MLNLWFMSIVVRALYLMLRLENPNPEGVVKEVLHDFGVEVKKQIK